MGKPTSFFQQELFLLFDMPLYSLICFCKDLIIHISRARGRTQRCIIYPEIMSGSVLCGGRFPHSFIIKCKPNEVNIYNQRYELNNFTLFPSCQRGNSNSHFRNKPTIDCRRTHCPPFVCRR